MKTMEGIQQALKYFVLPEDSSEHLQMTSWGGSSWLGAMKTILWAVVAIVLPLLLIPYSL